jgi:hypothetical protein
MREANAFALSPKGGCGAGVGRTIDESRENALADCRAHTRSEDCKLYAIGQRLAAN